MNRVATEKQTLDVTNLGLSRDDTERHWNERKVAQWAVLMKNTKMRDRK